MEALTEATGFASLLRALGAFLQGLTKGAHRVPDFWLPKLITNILRLLIKILYHTGAPNFLFPTIKAPT